MPLVKQCLDDLRRAAPRVVGLIQIDDEAGATGQLEGNVRDVEERLGKRPAAPSAVQKQATGAGAK